MQSIQYSDFTFSLLQARKFPFAKPNQQADKRRKEENQCEKREKARSSEQIMPDLNDTECSSNSTAGPAKFWSRHYFGSKWGVPKALPKDRESYFEHQCSVL